MNDALDILNRAYEYWKPNWIFFLYSGGYDSVCSTHIGVNWARSKMHPHAKVISVDTGVAADGWQDYVSRVARRWYYEHEFWINPNPEFYFEDSWDHGFPYTKYMHGRIEYINLKERAIDAGRAAHKAHRFDRCMLVTGIRHAESTDRATVAEWQVDGSALWVNPVLHWSDRDVYEYRLYQQFEVNPFYETVGGSGDCQCNWGEFIDLETLERYSPKLAAKIRPVDEHCRRVFGYGYGEHPSDAVLAENAGQMTLPGVEPIINLCASCDRHYDPIEATVTRLRNQQGGDA